MSDSSSFPRTGPGRLSRPDPESSAFSRGHPRSRSRSRERRDPPRTSVTDTWRDRDNRIRDLRRSPSPGRERSRLPPRPRSPDYGERWVKRPRLSSLDRARSSRDSSIEPGQYAPRSAVRRRRSPSYSTPELSRRPSSSSSGGPSPIKRQGSLSTSGLRTIEPIGRVDSAMLAFSRAMHSAMLFTSKHALASESYSRLCSFPAGQNNEAATGMIREAQSRVDDAEAALKRRMWELQQAFDAVLKARNEASSLPGSGNAKTSAPTSFVVEARQGAAAAAPVDAGPSKANESASTGPATANDADVDMISADATPASDGPAVSDAVAQQREGAKIKLRTLIGNLEHRVQDVENMRTSLEERYFDLENEFYVLHDDFIQGHRSRARPETWEAFERERKSLPNDQVDQIDPTDKGATQASVSEAGNAKASEGSAQAAQTDLTSADLAQPSAGAEDQLTDSALSAPRTDIASEPQDMPLSERTLEAIKAASAETLLSHELFLGALKTIGDLRTEVETLKTTVQRMEDGRIEREKMIIEDALRRAREHYTSIVGAELAKAVRNVNASRNASGSAAQPPGQPQQKQAAAPAPPAKPAAAPAPPAKPASAPAPQPHREPSAPRKIAPRPPSPTPSPADQQTGPGPRDQSSGAAPTPEPFSLAASAPLPPRQAFSLSATPRASQVGSTAPAAQEAEAAPTPSAGTPSATPPVATRASFSLTPAGPVPTSAVSPHLQSQSTAALGLKERLAVPPPASSSPSGFVSPIPSAAASQASAPAQQASHAPLAQRLNNASPQPPSSSSLQNRIASGGRASDGLPAFGSDTLGTLNSPSLQSRIEPPTKPLDAAASGPNGSGEAVYQAQSLNLAHPAMATASPSQASESSNGQNMSALASRITSAQPPQQPQQYQQQQQPEQLAWLHANGQSGGATPQGQLQNQSWQPR